jgi:hypothetical protein
MLHIDRVSAHIDLASSAAGPTAEPQMSDLLAALADPAARAQIKALVHEALRDHLRELERRGIV